MNTQTITTPGGEELVILPRSDYEALVAAAENAADEQAVRDFRRKLADGDEEMIPSEIVDRILSGENPIRVWRDHRGMTALALSKKARVGQGYLSQIETGKREGTIDTLRNIAEALSVTIDDLVG